MNVMTLLAGIVIGLVLGEVADVVIVMLMRRNPRLRALIDARFGALIKRPYRPEGAWSCPEHAFDSDSSEEEDAG